jgi:hypothetical protein
MTVPSRLLVRVVIIGVSIGMGMDTEVIVVSGTLSVASGADVKGSGDPELVSVDSGGEEPIVGAVVGIEDGGVGGAVGVVSGVVVVDGFGCVVEGVGDTEGVGVGEGVGEGEGVGVELGSPPQPCRDGTASGPLPISTRLVPQLAAWARCRLSLS